MLTNVLNKLDKVLKFETAEAQCDVPCGIYYPHLTQVSAHTVIRMNMLIAGLSKDDAEYDNKLARYIATKEEHGELLKHEVRVLWGDYFKEAHLEQFPQLHNIVWKIMKQGSECRQSTSLDHARELLATVLEFSEIFWKTKGKETKRIPTPYPTEGEMVILA